MDGFFEKYGRVIIIAVTICFVLLYLTPMRNVVGSSINGFAGSFANKVGESLGTVKMPDGSANVKREPSSMLIGGTTFRKKIPDTATSVVFCDETAPNGAKTVDLTSAYDGDVVGWLDGTTWKVSTQDSKKSVTFNTASSYMFSDLKNIKEIHFNNIDTSKVKNMSHMFDWCVNLEKLDLSSFDTSMVTDMSDMFAGCKSLKELDVSSFDTSNVTNMIAMFNGCENLKSLDVKSFDTSNITDMSYMFQMCVSLMKLNVSNFDTSNVTEMSYMFNGCANLTNIDVSHFDTSNVTDMVGMFSECEKLTNLNINNWNVSKVENMAAMFEHCKSLTTLNLGNWKTSNLNHTYKMFYECENLETLDLSHFDTSQIGNPTGNMNYMFQYCSRLKLIKARSQTDINNFKTKNTWINSNTKFGIA